MLYEKVKEVMIFCDTITTRTMIQMINDAGFVVGPTDMRFIEVVSIVVTKTKCTVRVLFLDTCRMSETHGEEHQIHFDIDEKCQVSNLDYVQVFC